MENVIGNRLPMRILYSGEPGGKIMQKTKQTAGEQFVLFKRGIGIRD